MSERVFQPSVQIQRFQNTSPEQVRLGIYNIQNDGISSFIDALKKHSDNSKVITKESNISNAQSKEKNDKVHKEKEKAEQLRQEEVIAYEKRKTLMSKHYGDPYLTVFIAHIPADATEEDMVTELKGKISGLTKCDVNLIQRKSPNCNTTISNNDKKVAKRHNYAFVTLGNKAECRQLLSMGRHIFIRGKNVVVEVERGRVVKNWLPKRLRKH